MKWYTTPYQQINFGFVIIIVLIFLYSLFYKPGNSYFFVSSCKGFPPQFCPSLGLQRSFSEIVRGNFQQSLSYNKYGINIFLFFVLQFIQRIVFMILVFKHQGKPMTGIALADGGIALISFFIFFYPFIFLT